MTHLSDSSPSHRARGSMEAMTVLPCASSRRSSEAPFTAPSGSGTPELTELPTRSTPVVSSTVSGMSSASACPTARLMIAIPFHSRAT